MSTERRQPLIFSSIKVGSFGQPANPLGEPSKVEVTTPAPGEEAAATAQGGGPPAGPVTALPPGGAPLQPGEAPPAAQTPPPAEPEVAPASSSGALTHAAEAPAPSVADRPFA